MSLDSVHCTAAFLVLETAGQSLLAVREGLLQSESFTSSYSAYSSMSGADQMLDAMDVRGGRFILVDRR